MLHYINVTLLFLLFGKSVFAATPSTEQLNLERISKMNRAIAKSFAQPKGIEFGRIISNLHNKKDKELFKRLSADKKSQVYEFFPLNDFLVISEKNKKKFIVLQLLSQNPLKVRVNNRRVYDIDKNNIHSSFFKKNYKVSYHSLFIPHANANETKSENDEWAFLYAAYTAYYEQIGLAPSEEDLGYIKSDLDLILKKLDIKKIECQPSEFNKNYERFDVTFVDGKKNKYYMYGNSGLYDIGIQTSRGAFFSNSDLFVKFGSLRFHLIDKILPQLREKTRNPELQNTDIDLNCTLESCSASIKQDAVSEYSQATINDIKKHQISTSESPEFKEQVEEYIKAQKDAAPYMEVDKVIGNDGGRVMTALGVCCQQKKCRDELRNTSHKLEVTPPVTQ